MKRSILQLLQSGAVRTCKPVDGQFVSPVFTVPKSNGGSRFILNLKQLNKFIEAPHFKLEDARTAGRLITRNSFLATIDLKDAYFLLPIHERHTKYLRFVWEGQLYEFTCLPFGLSVAPWCFTKLLRPVMRYLRERGHVSVIYLDDILCLGDTLVCCDQNIKTTLRTLERLGFIPNYKKSKLMPSSECVYLGLHFDTVLMRISLPNDKKEALLRKLKDFLKTEAFSIRKFAQLVGSLNFACQTNKYGWLHTKSLEQAKFEALRRNNGNYSRLMELSHAAKTDMCYWQSQLPTMSKSLLPPPYDYTMYTDSSKTGWGIKLDSKSTHGFWSASERQHHINYLELLAVFIGLKCFFRHHKNVNILLRVDNTTAISYINRMGSVQFPALNKLAREIWLWCEERSIWIHSCYVPSAKNFEADRESRSTRDDYEWGLNAAAYAMVTSKFGTPSVDLFATYQNAKCEIFASWLPDPQATYTDAFTLTWGTLKFYAFPPFSVIPRVLQKIRQEKAVGIVVVPNWPNQPWYPVFKSLVVGEVLILPPNANLLFSHADRKHPLSRSLSLAVAMLSGLHL